MACRLCGAVTCFGHREPRDHACPRAGDELRGTGGRIGAPGVSAAAALGLPPAAAGGSGSSSAAAPAPAVPAGSSKPLSVKDAALARSVALMRVKGKVPHADLKRVPEASRLFLEARLHAAAAAADGSASTAAAASAVAPVYVCADSSGTVGSLLDVLAGKLGVANPNATTTDEAARLHVYAPPPPSTQAAPVLLPFGARLSALVADGTVVNGGALLLVRGLLPYS